MTQSSVCRNAIESRSRKQRRPESFWVSMVEEFVGSGLSAAEFCTKKKLALSTFCKWSKRLKSIPPQKPSGLQEDFIPVYVSPTESRPIFEKLSSTRNPEDSAFRLHLSPHLHLSIHPDFDAPTLKKIVQTLLPKEGL